MSRATLNGCPGAVLDLAPPPGQALAREPTEDKHSTSEMPHLVYYFEEDT